MKAHSLFLALPLVFLFSMAPLAAEPLTMEQRIGAQRAIERVYYDHRLWPEQNPSPKPPFEQMVPREILEQKVRWYLAASEALEVYWGRPLTGMQLQAEMDRMAARSKDPETLRKLFAALDFDVALIAECIARPALAERLARNWYTTDERFHGLVREEAEALCPILTAENFEASAGDRYGIVRLRCGRENTPGHPRQGWLELDRREFDGQAMAFPEPGRITGVEETERAFRIRLGIRKDARNLEGAVIRFEKRPFEDWLAAESEAGLGSRIQIPSYAYKLKGIRKESALASLPDSWTLLQDEPGPRSHHSAVWTGTEMIVWGGGVLSDLNSGARYNPATDTWMATNVTDPDLPHGRWGHTAVWTGTEMIVWGGNYDEGAATQMLDSGGRYNPALDTGAADADCWSPTSDSGAPSARTTHTAVWTGTEMIVWGGYDGTGSLETGGSYNPVTDSWLTPDTGGGGRMCHSAVWTGERMIVWGGFDMGLGGYVDTGSRYDPDTDSWNPTAAVGAPSARWEHTAVWTGGSMIVWGGRGNSEGEGSYKNTGGLYDPLADSWTATSTGADLPTAREYHTAVWTGERMIIWGGHIGGAVYTDTGAIYDPRDDTWTTTSTGAGVPKGRHYHTAVWTGTEMIVWGGEGSNENFNTGGRYNPELDSWVAVQASAGVPSLRENHSMVWDGVHLLVWGGEGCIDAACSGTDYLNTGASYIPTTDSWGELPTSGNCPTARSHHTAVWTGLEMVVWGGWTGEGNCVDTGATYDPVADAWTSATASSDAPTARVHHTALWTGTEMIVWGGHQNTGLFTTDTGARWAPEASPPGPGSWSSTAPPAGFRRRKHHSAVWTGDEMVVWGGMDCTEYTNCFTEEALGDGAMYDPATDGWAPIDGTGAPSPRLWHSAVWTGIEMIIWGGNDWSIGFLEDGGRWNRSLDQWNAQGVAPDGAPTLRQNHSAIWTGNEMLLWGGHGDYAPGESWYKNSGGRYDPVSDSWRTMPMANVPSPRAGHPALWTGQAMIVWDGSPGSQTGGIFYPDTPPIAVPEATIDQGSGGGDETAVFSAAFQAPRCASIGRSCDSGTLLEGRGNITGGIEPNQPNTIGDSCPDGDIGDYTIDLSVEAIRLGTTDGTPFEPGRQVIMEVDLYGSGAGDTLLFYYAADASDPHWILVDSQSPLGGSETLSTVFRLASGTTQAVRAVLTDGAITSPCIPGNLNDHDDLIFEVEDISGATTFNLGSGDTILLIASSSTDGSNTGGSPANHDAFDSIVSYEWDLDSSAGWSNPSNCQFQTTGDDFTGEVLSLDEADLATLNLDQPASIDIWLRVTDVRSNRDCESVPLSIRDSIFPSLEIVTPAGGTAWEYSPSAGDRKTHLISWNASDDYGIVRTWIEYTSDGGSTWTCIADSDDLPACPADNESGSDTLLATDQNFNWDMPTHGEAAIDGQTFPSSRSIIRVTVEDVSGNQTTAISSGFFYIIQPTTTAVRTLILTHSARIENAYPGEYAGLLGTMNNLAANTKVSGAVLDLDNVPGLNDLYDTWDAIPTDTEPDRLANIAAANAVADAVRDYVIEQVDTTYTNAEYLVLVGNDDIIPHYRVADGTEAHLESNYSADVECDSPLGAAICEDHYLTDNTFGDLEYDTPIVGVAFLALPDLATGRLVETPTEMAATIDRFIAQDGQVDLDAEGILVTGYDFLEDGTTEVETAYLGAGEKVDALLGTGWDAAELDQWLFNDPEDVAYDGPHLLNNLNDHTTHYTFGTPSGDLTTTAMDAAHSGAKLANSLFYNVGCHSGLNAPDADFSAHEPLDLPQFILSQGSVAYVGNTGFGWGLLHGVGYSEKLMSYITSEILAAPQAALGRALVEAKRNYYVEDHRYDVFDEKVLFESTLYGLPMYTLVRSGSKSMPRRLLSAEGPDHQVLGDIEMKKSRHEGPARDLPDGVTELTLTFDFSASYGTINTTPHGTYWALNGVVGAEAGDVIQPMFLYDSRLSGTSNHGVLYTGGTFVTQGGVDPVVGVPQSSNPAGSEGPIGPSAGSFIPTISRTATARTGMRASMEELNRMTVYTGYYAGDENGPGVEARFDTMDFVIYYSNSSDEDGPAITDPDPDPSDPQPDVYTLHTMNGLTAEFSVEAADASGVYRVVVVYTDGQATWQSLDLAYNGTSGMWEGDLDLYQSIQYHVQAVDNTGNVGFLTKDGSDEDDSGGIYGSTFSAARIFQAILVDNDVDYDGLPNSEEATESTDPQNPDSDGDGDNDGSEAHNGRDPLDPADGERITITTALVNGGEDVQIEWPSALGNNGAIDGPYWIYRSTDVSFDAAEILVTTPYPIPDGTETWTDSGTGSAPETYYYKVLNARYLDPAPVVNVVFPNDGPETGGTSVTIYGEHFSEGDTVTFGFAPAAAVVVVSDLAITCETPAGAGTAKVIVTRRNGQFGEKIGGFTYTP